MQSLRDQKAGGGLTFFFLFPSLDVSVNLHSSVAAVADASNYQKECTDRAKMTGKARPFSISVSVSVPIPVPMSISIPVPVPSEHTTTLDAVIKFANAESEIRNFDTASFLYLSVNNLNFKDLSRHT